MRFLQLWWMEKQNKKFFGNLVGLIQKFLENACLDGAQPERAWSFKTNQSRAAVG